MNILILSANSKQLQSNNYPTCLTEIDGVPLIQHIADLIKPLNAENVIYTFHQSHVNKFHLDHVIKQLDSSAKIISIEHETQGAACTALLASKYIDNKQPLLIISANELVKVDLENVCKNFESLKYDGGAVIFPSVHPRYSFVLLDENDLIVEAAEKMPISRHATTGIYWYAKGESFINAAKSMIRKDARVNNLFYICPAFNEMLLQHLIIGSHAIEAKNYIQFKNN